MPPSAFRLVPYKSYSYSVILSASTQHYEGKSCLFPLLDQACVSEWAENMISIHLINTEDTSSIVVLSVAKR